MDISQPVIGRPVALRTVRLGDLLLDRSYQRQLSQAWVERLVRELREEYMPPLHVSARAGGELYVVDGQHRVVALLRRHGADAAVRVIVHEGLSFTEERMLFFILNKALQVSQLHIHQVGAALDAGVEGVIAETLETYRLTGRIASLKVLREIAEDGGEWGLQRVLAIVAFAWREQARQVRRDMLYGLWQALKSDDNADEEIALGLLQVSPAELERRIRVRRMREECSGWVAAMVELQAAAASP